MYFDDIKTVALLINSVKILGSILVYRRFHEKFIDNIHAPIYRCFLLKLNAINQQYTVLNKQQSQLKVDIHLGVTVTF